MTAQTKEGINLLPEKGFTSTTSGRILAWILSTFRIIVIVTEIIVMIAFLSRFWLDARSTDLTEEINQKRAVLVASSNFESEFKNTQKKLEIYASLVDDVQTSSDVIDGIVSTLPADVFLTGINIAEGKTSIKGRSPNERSIQQFLVNISGSEVVENPNLTKASADPEDPTIIEFQISGKVR